MIKLCAESYVYALELDNKARVQIITFKYALFVFVIFFNDF